MRVGGATGRLGGSACGSIGESFASYVEVSRSLRGTNPGGRTSHEHRRDESDRCCDQGMQLLGASSAHAFRCGTSSLSLDHGQPRVARVRSWQRLFVYPPACLSTPPPSLPPARRALSIPIPQHVGSPPAWAGAHEANNNFHAPSLSTTVNQSCARSVRNARTRRSNLSSGFGGLYKDRASVASIWPQAQSAGF